MSLIRANTSFGDLKKTLFSAGETPYMVWREAYDSSEDQRSSQEDVDVIEVLRFNIDQLRELNSRFGFLLEELSTVLVKKK